MNFLVCVTDSEKHVWSEKPVIYSATGDERCKLVFNLNSEKCKQEKKKWWLKWEQILMTSGGAAGLRQTARKDTKKGFNSSKYV